jgi:hypothetical protein
MLAAKDPDPVVNATNDASSLIHPGSLESKPGRRAARAVRMKQSPKNQAIATLFREASAALAPEKQDPK